jgi:hypothetical protein
MAKTITHTIGYHVWLYGEHYWHRTLDGAWRRLDSASGYCSGDDAQIIEVSTGDRIY